MPTGSDDALATAHPAAPHHPSTRRRDTMDRTEAGALPDGALEASRQVSTSTVAMQLFKRGFRQPQLLGVRPLSEVADGFVGEAFTTRFIPMREDVDTLDQTHHRRRRTGSQPGQRPAV